MVIVQTKRYQADYPRYATTDAADKADAERIVYPRAPAITERFCYHRVIPANANLAKLLLRESRPVDPPTSF